MAFYELTLLNDNGMLDTFSARCAGDVSGGGFVDAASGTNSLSSGANSYTTSDVRVVLSTGSRYGNAPIGIALETISSGTNNYVSVLRCGDVILEGSAAIVAGDGVQSTQLTSATLSQVAPLTALGSNKTSTIAENMIGRAYTASADGVFGIVRVNF